MRRRAERANVTAAGPERAPPPAYAAAGRPALRGPASGLALRTPSSGDGLPAARKRGAGRGPPLRGRAG